MQKKGPIGVFDSGYGGLTVLSSLKESLPNYDFLYFGDNARSPYGTRSFETVYEYTLEAVEALFQLGCPLVILACNTASAKALRSIQQKDLINLAPKNRVLGVVRPSAEIIGSLSKTNHVGILATEGTVKSESYIIEIGKFSPETKVYQQACPMWVPLIENGEHETEAGRLFIQRDLNRLLEQSPSIDTIVLGCTHYPVLKDFLESILPKGMNVISQGPIVAESLKDYLQRHPEMDERLTQEGKVQYFTSGNAEDFDIKASQIINEHISSIHLHL